ncbi:lysophospholipid acyltransferase family protein [Dawidia soli]|uniref:1-acyl-sn-glycerol-3-phosphate acyltransferase n=1 Tax=Dawidia soli TaxID=2782352 RepID=A0AAP2GFN3_9BACT|nr:lysophospholipid acyltransferase family protein [Dawidia soli]MBT1689644.1 1-acyl-sn-glycerol-3-phosphate acyltransferase [Dawidia soli]
MQKLVLQLVYSVVVKAFLRIIVGVKFDNGKFLLNEKQFIIIANHNSHLDTMTILASLPRKLVHKVKPVAAADHFGKTKLKEKLSNYFVNTLLIQRKRDKENPANDPIHRMIHALDNGYSLILFPEGTRGAPEVQQPLKPGVALVLLQRPHIKYVPAFMTGMGKAMPKEDSLIVPFNCRLIYGTPQLISDTEVEPILNRMQQDLTVLQGKLA